jgi:hypothetical protein
MSFPLAISMKECFVTIKERALVDLSGVMAHTMKETGMLTNEMDQVAFIILMKLRIKEFG